MRDLSFDPVKGTFLSIPLFLLLLALGLLPYQLIWSENAFGLALERTGFLGFLAFFAGGIVIHELIHGVAWKIAGDLAWSEIKFGFAWKALAPYAHAKKAMPAGAYRVGALMPGILTGLVPVVLGTAFQWPVLVGYGALLLSAAGGDLLIVLRIVTVPSDALLRDHPTRFGAELVEEG